MALLVDLRVEGRWPPARRALLGSVGGLVVLDRDGGLDLPSPQVGPVALRTVGLIAQNPLRSGPGPASAQTGHPDTVHDGGELRAVPSLPGGNQQRHRFTALLTAQVQLGGPAPPRPPQTVISRFRAANTTGRFLLLRTVTAGTGRVLVRPGDRGIHADIPGDQPGRI